MWRHGDGNLSSDYRVSLQRDVQCLHRRIILQISKPFRVAHQSCGEHHSDDFSSCKTINNIYIFPALSVCKQSSYERHWIRRWTLASLFLSRSLHLISVPSVNCFIFIRWKRVVNFTEKILLAGLKFIKEFLSGQQRFETNPKPAVKSSPPSDTWWENKSRKLHSTHLDVSLSTVRFTFTTSCDEFALFAETNSEDE